MSMSGGHVCCMTLVVVAVMALAVTLAAPYWATARLPPSGQEGGGLRVGLLLACAETSAFFQDQIDSACRLLAMDPHFGWFEQCRWVLGSGTVLLLLASLFTMGNMCYGSEDAAQVTGIFVILGGLLAGVGGGMFAIQYEESVAQALGSLVAVAKLSAWPPVQTYSLDWACFLELAACSLLVFLGLVLVSLPKNRANLVRPL